MGKENVIYIQHGVLSSHKASKWMEMEIIKLSNISQNEK
jgi:hypothetical protein